MLKVPDHGQGFQAALIMWTERKNKQELTQPKARGSVQCPQRSLALRSALAILSKKRTNNNISSMWECWQESHRFFWCFGHRWVGAKWLFFRGCGKCHLRNTDVAKEKVHIVIAEVTRNVNGEDTESCSVVHHFYSIQLTSVNSNNFPFLAARWVT